MELVRIRQGKNLYIFDLTTLMKNSVAVVTSHYYKRSGLVILFNVINPSGLFNARFFGIHDL